MSSTAIRIAKEELLVDLRQFLATIIGLLPKYGKLSQGTADSGGASKNVAVFVTAASDSTQAIVSDREAETEDSQRNHRKTRSQSAVEARSLRNAPRGIGPATCVHQLYAGSETPVCRLSVTRATARPA